ncbi:DUF4233 domain-containing protein [Subtercola frigoramans]|uniref:ABC-type multidrug transport system permease subunit n=1 Tax=Subtercola frigoramans TaxID=120298 RepID=A0ABS2L6P6_9MICO|nr:DUF4233 domain-containing protein [Subtercola frigoramans]MBM7472732.1 ABC-type multidrug transport system permease subunit [Subtercola frigoramans]
MSDESPPSDAGGAGEPVAGSAARGGRVRGPRRQRSVRESLASIVLGFESVIMFLATLAVFGLKALPPFVALGGGAALCILLLATIPLLSRPIGIIMGWTLQGLILASALLVPLMLVVAVLFGTMWIYCMVKGARIDRENAQLASGA